MKKIIKGKMYDTDTARLVGASGHGLRYGDFDWTEEALYCKRTGEYFFHGAGGAGSCYAQSTGVNSWSGGAVIRPMSVSDARTWAENNLTADEFQQEFGAVAEDESRTVLSISMRADIADIARRKAADAGLSLSAYIENCIK